MKNVLQPLAKGVLIPLGLTAAASPADSEKHKKYQDPNLMILEPLARTTTLIISKEETEGIMKIVKSFEDSNLLLKGISETIQNQAKEKRRISQYAIRYIRCYFIRKYVSR